MGSLPYPLSRFHPPIRPAVVVVRVNPQKAVEQKTALRKQRKGNDMKVKSKSMWLARSVAATRMAGLLCLGFGGQPAAGSRLAAGSALAAGTTVF